MSYDDDRERIYHPENFESLAETEERENEEGEELDTTGFNDPEVPEVLNVKSAPISKIKRMTDDLNESMKRNFYAKK